MITISETTEFHIDERTAVAIGKFDGIHLGHKALFDKLNEKKKEGLKTAVFSFYPSPAMLFNGKEEASLFTREEKRAAMEEAGVDYFIEFPFTQKTAAITPEDFIKKILKGCMNASYIVAGNDVSFGKGGKGDAKLLHKESLRYGYEMEIVDKVLWHGKEISSTLVRDMIRDSRMEDATELLGQPYYISGVVTEGKKLGRKLDFPTANIYPPHDKLLPKNGVYQTLVKIIDPNADTADIREYSGITNIGIRPSFNDGNRVSAETHLISFDEEEIDSLYGKEIIVRLLKFIRKEKRFDSTEDLKAAVENDIKTVKKIISREDR